MIKRTLYFGNPAYLSMKHQQLEIRMPEFVKDDISKHDNLIATIPIEDIGVVMLDHPQITITQMLMEKLLENNVAIITCDSSHLPVGLMLPLCGNSVQSERFSKQINASVALKKQLWAQTVAAKINNQAWSLKHTRGIEVNNMVRWANDTKPDTANALEAKAAAYYWKNFFPDIPHFSRDRFGEYPNNLLNYGYGILRAIVARALVSSGLLPTLGLFHKNKYNAYCLADDIMEPYRPFVDVCVADIYETEKAATAEISKYVKSKLLGIATADVTMEGKCRPLMVAVSHTTASLYRCFSGESRKIIYPTM